jgi:transposase
MAKIVFKTDKRNQLFLLPPELGEMIPKNNLVRVVDQVIDQIDITSLTRTYKGGGTSSYHPRMLLKVLVYGYISGTYTTRKIEKALRENIYFMWLSGMSQIDHVTIHNFRFQRMKQIVDDIFTSVVLTLIEGGYIKMMNINIDGTKIEANANRYSYVWKKNVERHKKSVEDKIRGLLKEIDQLQEEEDNEYGDGNLEEVSGKITSDQIKKTVYEINKRLQKKGGNTSIKQKVKKIEKEHLPRLKEYEDQEEKLNGRNSYSKTDPDATFFRMKEDHIGNSQLKPGYNVQIGTENQFIVGYGIYQKAADTSLLNPLLDKMYQGLNRLPKNLITDAGYGSEENYENIKKKRIGNFVKYNNFDYEKTGKYKKEKYRSEHFHYDKKTDQYVCPEGRRLAYIRTRKLTTDNGYKTTRKIYECLDCSGCSHKEQCCKNCHNRRIEISHKLNRYKETARKNLESEEGIRLRAQRVVDVESVFGQIKWNKRFRRFLTKGLENVNTEWGLISIAHNIAKLARLFLGEEHSLLNKLYFKPVYLII